MNAKKIAIAALGSLLLVGGIAHAAPWGDRDGRRGPDGPRADAAFVRLLKIADADKDGKVTKEETEAGFLKIFDTIDTNKDSAATPGEFRAYIKARMEEFRKTNPELADTKDGGPKQALNDDGPDGDRRGPPPHHGEGPRGGKHHAERGDGPRGDGHRWFSAGKDDDGRRMPVNFILRQADADDNGQVSRDEAKAFASKVFVRLDVNKDGVISIDDIPDRPFP